MTHFDNLPTLSLLRTSIGISLLLLLVNSEYGHSQCIILPNAIEEISYTYVLPDGTNASGIAYNPNLDIYYTVIAGNSGFPLETFDPSGASLFQSNTGFDFRGLWWNANTSQLEGNGYYNFGLWSPDLNANGYALNTGTSIFTGQNQPDAQSCGDYDYCADEIIYYFNGAVYRVNRTTNALLGSFALTGLPVPLSNINTTSIVFTGCSGNEIALEDYVNKNILLFNKTTGAYSGSSQLPANAVTSQSFRLSYANNMIWLYDAYTRTWTSYSIFENTGNGNIVDLGNDTTLCNGDSLILIAGSSDAAYLWSTGATDSSITINSSGSYWVTTSNGACAVSDTIVITDTLCNPVVSINATDTLICEKFCISFFDVSQNNPIAWHWIFEGASPSTSSIMNPENICYSVAGSFDVTLITTNATGNDTLILTDYITVTPTPSTPTIIANGYELTVSAADSYQWQYNLVDIAGATNQSYTATQSGLYTVNVFDQFGCKNSASVTVLISGIDAITSQAALSIFPNPGFGTFTIQLTGLFPGKPLSLLIHNSIGQIIFSVEEIPGDDFWKKEINLEPVASGFYLVEIRSGDKYFRKKLIVLD
ncbi:MAG: T9SS type A sorting domain-containing protein [Chitinophagaceae bacterium]|nr:T9SS type A sorting domain-containing protein [Chitinophagaceae bacterium]